MFQQNRGCSSLVCKLHKVIYGLKQSPGAWFDKLPHFLISVGFESLNGWQFSPFKVHRKLNDVYFGVCWQYNHHMELKWWNHNNSEKVECWVFLRLGGLELFSGNWSYKNNRRDSSFIKEIHHRTTKIKRKWIKPIQCLLLWSMVCINSPNKLKMLRTRKVQLVPYNMRLWPGSALPIVLIKSLNLCNAY